MNMNKAVGMAVFAVGIVLLVYGFNATGSLGSHLSKFFNGAPSDKAIWLLASGAITGAVGAFVFFKK